MEIYKDPVSGPGGPLGGGGGGSGNYVTYTDREYVWGPDYVDECLWQVTKTGEVMHVLQDASMDVVATLDASGAVTRQWTYDPYGQPIVDESFGSSAHNRLGHHGLFFDRLDATAPGVELVSAARGLYHNRNRTYEPRLGRFTSEDPNATGTGLLGNVTLDGSTAVDLADFDAAARYADGPNLYAYVRSEPLNGRDPMGLYGFEDGFQDYMDYQNMKDPVPTPGNFILNMYQSLFATYAANLDWDSGWAGDWDLPDEMHTRNDDAWVAMAMLQGLYDSFAIELPFTDDSVNPLDLFAGTVKVRVRGKRGPVHGHPDLHFRAIRLQRVQWAQIPGIKGLEVNKAVRDQNGKVLRDANGKTVHPDLQMWYKGELWVFEKVNTHRDPNRAAKLRQILDDNGLKNVRIVYRER
jgi:uncharacterized protein RhaS with RHS repeats